MLKDKYFFKKSIIKRQKKFKSTCQTCDTDYETVLTIYKINYNKLWNSISNKLNIKIRKKIYISYDSE